ncbi:hypothetical protein N7520_004886 [Penicillium odoratum]|uniref:uncharacterized protein n=1 Tax=Penicillium odoratum TaxID=1167516 RepID=UPI0025499003|nr:uncharacterized protein N7520_004886 [Penicillium odoratum]KAJ5765327.1 hypothetical protein N7520_004886 [Penicillium odoratum]
MSDSTAKFGDIQNEGAQRRRWIANPSEPGCYIEKSTLTFHDLVNRYNSGLITTDRVVFSQEIDDHVLEKIKELEKSRKVSSDRSKYATFDLNGHDFSWSGIIGPGIIVLSSIFRVKKEPGTQVRDMDLPRITASAVTQAFYTRDFDIESLRCIFVSFVINKSTIEFITEQLYENATWADDVPRTWEYGTPEYDGLIGTRIGRVIAYFVLGAYDRGTHRISSIVTYPCPTGGVHMRFDIEAI